MRPQQQNRRMRGRNNNNNNNNNNNRGKGNGNPLTRSYESNGPDVKIRGNAQQIAEKYAALARDAQSSGDRVMAENYLQHAEHYNRIIAAAQAQMPIQNYQQNREDFDDEDGEDREEFEANGSDQGNAYGSGPQPVIDGVPAEVALNGENGEQNGDGQPRHRDGNRNRNRDGRNRDRNRDFQNRNGEGQQRREFQPREDQRDGAASAEGEGDDSLPAFVTQAAPVAPYVEAVEQSEPAPEAPRRTRRPRRSEAREDAAEPVGELQSASDE